MMRSKRLDTVVRIAGDRERDAVGMFAESRNRLAVQEQRLEMLLGYRAEYEERFKERGAEGMDMGRLLEYRAFLDRLNRAIEQQRAALTEAQQRMTADRQRWLEETRRAKSLSKVQERLRGDEQRSADAREQRETDERAGRLASRSDPQP
ncbi:MAG: flagellar export protein FliJ [Porticoccaceae bacterium]